MDSESRCRRRCDADVLRRLAPQLSTIVRVWAVFFLTAFGLLSCVTIDKSDKRLVADWNARVSGSGRTSDCPWSGFTPDVNGKREFVYEGLAVKDYEYRRYVLFIRRSVSWGGFGADAAAIGLSTAGSLVSSASKVLSGASAAVTGSQASFNKNILFDQSITTFISQMDALRTTKLAEITAKLESDKIGEYSLAEAYRDLEEYGRVGTLDAALSEVGKKAGNQQKQATTQINKIKRLKGLDTGLGD
jgi:hypothetical protein